MLKNSVSINPEKSEAIIFTRKIIKTPPCIRMLNCEISWINKVKYLGVILDAKLRWGPAIKDRIARANATLKMLYPLINRKNALREEFKLLLYKMCARPALLYAAPVWAAEYRLKLIQTTQNKFLRIILNTNYRTRIETLRREANIEYSNNMTAKLLEKNI